MEFIFRVLVELLFIQTARQFLRLFNAKWPEWAEIILGLFLVLTGGTIIVALLR